MGGTHHLVLSMLSCVVTINVLCRYNYILYLLCIMIMLVIKITIILGIMIMIMMRNRLYYPGDPSQEVIPAYNREVNILLYNQSLFHLCCYRFVYHACLRLLLLVTTKMLLLNKRHKRSFIRHSSYKLLTGRSTFLRDRPPPRFESTFHLLIEVSCDLSSLSPCF